MWNEPLNDAHRLAISTALYPLREAIFGLSSIEDTTRQKAYTTLVDAIWSIDGMEEAPSTIVPDFFMEGGSILLAIGYVREQVRAGIQMKAWFLAWIIQRGCRECTLYDEKVDGDTHSSEEQTTSYTEAVRILVRWLIGDIPTETPSYFTLSAYVAYHIDSNPDKTKTLLDQAIELDPKNPENYLQLGQVYYKSKDFERAYDTFYTWLQESSNHTLFEAFIGLSFQRYGDVQTKKSFFEHKPDSYIFPYSYARWVYTYGDSQDDLRYLIAVKIDSGDMLWKFPPYTKSALDVLDMQIKGLMRYLHIDAWVKRKDILEKDEYIFIELLETLETEIFYLLSFRYLSIYLKLLRELIKSKKWQTWLGEYYGKHRLEGIMDEPEEDTKNSITDQEGGTPTLQADISWWWTLKEGLASRLARIMLYASYHSGDIGESLKDTSTPHTGYVEEMLLMKEISTDYVWPSMLTGWEYFERKRNDEEMNMMYLGPRTSNDYDALTEDIDDEYGITVRRYLAHAARNDTYTWWEFPPICAQVSAFQYFFIAERLIAWQYALFNGSLPQILWKIDTTDIRLVVTLAEILFVKSYSEEAIDLICGCPWALDDIDALMVVVQSLRKYSGDESDLDRLYASVDETLSDGYDQPSLFTHIESIYQERHILLQEKIVQEALDQDGELIVSEERMDEIEILSMFEYMTAVLLEDSDTDTESRSALLDAAISHGSAEAFFQRSLDDMEDGIPRDNILEGLVDYFPQAEYPVRREFFFWIISIARDLGETGRAYEFIKIARMEGLDFFSLMAGDTWGTSERRSLFYTLYIREGFDTLISDAPLDYLRQGIEDDMRDASLPLHTRLSAAFVQTQISPSETLWYIPGYLHYWDFLVRQVLLDPTDPTMMEECIGFLSDIHRDFDSDEVPKESLIWVAVLQFQAMRIYTFIKSSLNAMMKAWAPQDDVWELLWLSIGFIKNILSLIARIPDFRNIAHIETVEGKSPHTLAVPDFWYQEYLRICTDIHAIEHPDSRDSLNLPFTTDWGQFDYFPPHITLQ